MAATNNKLRELEDTLLDQIEKLNQDDICANKEAAEVYSKKRSNE